MAASLDLDDMAALLNAEQPESEMLQPLRRTSSMLKREVPSSAWSRGLSTFSVAASLLCILDCTVLPLAFLVMSFANVGFVNMSPCELHCLSQKLGLYVVLPIGSLAAITNFLQHRHTSVFLAAVTGLVLIALSNMPTVLSW